MYAIFLRAYSRRLVIFQRFREEVSLLFLGILLDVFIFLQVFALFEALSPRRFFFLYIPMGSSQISIKEFSYFWWFLRIFIYSILVNSHSACTVQYCHFCTEDLSVCTVETYDSEKAMQNVVI